MILEVTESEADSILSRRRDQDRLDPAIKEAFRRIREANKSNEWLWNKFLDLPAGHVTDDPIPLVWKLAISLELGRREGGKVPEKYL